MSHHRPILHRQVPPIPPEVIAQITRDDEMLNAIDARLYGPARHERIGPPSFAYRAVEWLAIGLCVFCIAYFAARFAL